MKSRVLKNISTQIYLLSPNLGVVADKVENRQAVSSVWKGYLSHSLPPKAMQMLGSWKLWVKVAGAPEGAGLWNRAELGLQSQPIPLASSLWTGFSVSASGCPPVKWG